MTCRRIGREVSRSRRAVRATGPADSGAPHRPLGPPCSVRLRRIGRPRRPGRLRRIPARLIRPHDRGSHLPPTRLPTPATRLPTPGGSVTIAIGVSVIVIAGLIAVGFLASSGSAMSSRRLARRPSCPHHRLVLGHLRVTTDDRGGAALRKLARAATAQHRRGRGRGLRAVRERVRRGRRHLLRRTGQDGNAWAWARRRSVPSVSPISPPWPSPPRCPCRPGQVHTDRRQRWCRSRPGQHGAHLGVGVRRHGATRDRDTVQRGARLRLRLDAPATLRFTSISAGLYDTLAVDASGHAWSWGTNSSGTLGDGNATQPSLGAGRTSPCPRASRSPLWPPAAIHSLALDSTGQAWAWGRDLYGDLGVSCRRDGHGVRLACGPDLARAELQRHPRPRRHACRRAGSRASQPAATSYSEALDTTLAEPGPGDPTKRRLGTDPGVHRATHLASSSAPAPPLPFPSICPPVFVFVALTINGEDTPRSTAAGHVWWWGKDTSATSWRCRPTPVRRRGGTVSAGPCSATALPLAMPSGSRSGQWTSRRSLFSPFLAPEAIPAAVPGGRPEPSLPEPVLPAEARQCLPAEEAHLRIVDHRRRSDWATGPAVHERLAKASAPALSFIASTSS